MTKRDLILLAGCILLSSQLDSSSSSDAAAAAARRTLLGDGITECASCPNNDKLACSGTTVADEFCAPCATGQLWWPCNIPEECYCKDLVAAAAEVEAEATTTAAAIGNEPTITTTSTTNITSTSSPPPCEIPLCEPGEYNLTKIVPFTNCTQYGSCTAGIPGTIQTCPPGQAYSAEISACNILSLVTTCVEDTPCPMASPTSSPVMVLLETSDTGMTMDGSSTSSSSSGSSSSSAPGVIPVGKPRMGIIDPSILEGMYVLDAHMAANKIALARDLLSGPTGGSYGNDYSFATLRSSLHFMITIGAANQTFYIGQATPPPTTGGDGAGAEHGRVDNNNAAYGLVNIAAFVAMSVEDSIARGSCDELNSIVVEGVLPFSNACGQNGINYQTDLKCSKEESMYDCNVDVDMRVMANHPMSGNSNSNNNNRNNVALPKPFFCGPKSDYGGNTTGFWDYVNGVESKDPATSEIGRQDVEGCCWWGRGSLQLRGTCAYGKLNYFLGKRAADEGRPSMFPDIDFCRNPQAVCSDVRYPDLKWIAGLFRWVTEIQSYNKEGFQYVQQLREFVDGGLQDWSFVQGVSGIVTQGCHEPPCQEGAAELDGTDRLRTFIKTLRVLGLPVKDETIPFVETSR